MRVSNHGRAAVPAQPPLCSIPELPLVRGWVLIEHAGPWGFSVEETEPVLAAEVGALAAARNFRINLVRRPGRRPGSTGRCFVSSFAGGQPVIEEVTRPVLQARFGDLVEAAAAGHPSGLGVAVREPLYLICTNDQRNPACGRRGRPVARALAATNRSVWETTHVGGCRFAVNLVCLPSGVYYRQVATRDVRALIEATEQGRIVLPSYGGRSGLSAGEHAAEWAVRSATGLDGIDAVRVGAVGPVGADGVRHVDVDSDHGRYRALLRPRDPAGRRYEVSELARLSTAGGPIKDGSRTETNRMVSPGSAGPVVRDAVKEVTR